MKPPQPRLSPARARFRAPRPRRSDSLACRTLVAVARQRKGLDATRCQLVFEHLDAAHSVQAALHRTLSTFQLTELQFGVLVALFALDPEPVMPADLADYTAVSRAAITEALVQLERLEFVTRTRDVVDRRVYHLQLTDPGRATLEAALMRYLTTVGEVARHLDSATQADLLLACQRLQRGASELS